MKKRLVIVIIIAVAFIVFLSACDSCNSIDLFGGSNSSADPQTDSIEAMADNDAESPNDPETPGTDESDIEGTSEMSGFGGSEGDVPLIIEIIEDRIIFDGDDISIVELEALLISYVEHEYVWEIHDVHQAVKAVYDNVVALFNKHNIAYREK